jgi:hypothetical protein
MKNVFVIPVHSFVDLITNSSSELFVCNGNKSIEAIKEVLIQLTKNHNELSEDKINLDILFTSVFKEPEIVEYSFDYYLFPQNLRDEYEKYHHVPGEYNSFFPYEERQEYKDLEFAEQQMELEVNIHEKDLYKTNKIEYERRWNIVFEKRDEIWKEWNRKKCASVFELYKHFLISNNLPEWKEKEFNLNKLYANKKEYNFFRTCLSWGISCKKGDIFLYSAIYNTIPYEMMEAITAYLNAQRLHLG